MFDNVNNFSYNIEDRISDPESLILEDNDEKEAVFHFEKFWSYNGGETKYDFLVKLSDRKKRELNYDFINDIDNTYIKFNWNTLRFHYDKTYEDYLNLPPEKIEAGSEMVYFIIDKGEEAQPLNNYNFNIDSNVQQVINEAILVIKEANDFLSQS